MPTGPHDLGALLQSILREEAEGVAPAVDLEAALSDPTLRGLIDRVTQHYEAVLTPRGLDHARRTLALVFTTDPAAVSLLAQMREEEASGTVPVRPVHPGRARRRSKP